MKVKVNAGKGPIHGNYGLKNDGDVFTLPAHQGKELNSAGLVEILDDAEGEDEKPTAGKDMTKLRKGNSILAKEQKQAAQRQTKEEKQTGTTKEAEPEAPATEETPAV